MRDVLRRKEEDEFPTEHEVRQRERALLGEAREWGLGMSPSGFITDLQLLANLQHHGAPTRLLDVTTNPMTALWFACQSPRTGRDAAGALFAFDVTDVPTYESMSYGSASYGDQRDPAGWSLRFVLAVSQWDRRPFLVRPTIRDERMQVQEGLFLASAVRDTPSRPAGLEGFELGQMTAPGAERLAALFGPEERPQGRPPVLPFCVLVIPPTVKHRVLPHLEGTYNRRYSTLLPDLDGDVQALREGYVEPRPPLDDEDSIFG